MVEVKAISNYTINQFRRRTIMKRALLSLLALVALSAAPFSSSCAQTLHASGIEAPTVHNTSTNQVMEFSYMKPSPDGRNLAIMSTDGNLYVADVNGNNLTDVSEGYAGFPYNWSPDGSKIAYTTYDDKGEQLHVVNLDSGHDTIVAAFDGVLEYCYWSPDGHKLACLATQIDNEAGPVSSSVEVVFVEPDISPLASLHGRIELDQVEYGDGFSTDPWSDGNRSVLYTKNGQRYEANIDGVWKDRIADDTMAMSNDAE
jgi:dipeptidyl aminopeptidase/acylaminoacyl peptidase